MLEPKETNEEDEEGAMAESEQCTNNTIEIGAITALTDHELPTTEAHSEVSDHDIPVDDGHKGVVEKLYKKFRQGYIRPTSAIPAFFKDKSIPFKWKAANNNEFKSICVNKEVLFRFDEQSLVEKPIAKWLATMTDDGLKILPVVGFQTEEIPGKAREKTVKFDTAPKSKTQPNSNDVQPLMSIPITTPAVSRQKNPKKTMNQLDGTIRALKNLNSTEPFGFIEPDNEITFPDGSCLDRGLFFSLRNVRPSGIELSKGDRVKFAMRFIKDDRVTATRVYLQSFASDKSARELCTILQQMYDQFVGSTTGQEGGEKDTYGFLNLINNDGLWKSIGNSINLDEEGIQLLIDTICELKINCEGLKSNFISILKTLTHTMLFEPKIGKLEAFIRDAVNDKDVSRLSKVQHLFLALAGSVPSKMATITSLVKPMLQNPEIRVDTFIWRLLKISVKGNETTGENQEWTELPLVPTSHEIINGPESGAFNLRPIIKDGPYESVDEYLDTNFRLLRADCFSALNKGIRDFINGTLDKRDMHAYCDLKLHGIQLRDYDVPLTVALRVKPIKPVKNWDKSSNFMYGNLACISIKGSFKDHIWATVSDRSLLQKHNVVVLEIATENNSMTDADVIFLLQNMTTSSVMVESPTYYKAYQTIIKTLKNNSPEDVPFVGELVEGKHTERSDLYNEGTTLDPMCVSNHNGVMTVDEFKTACDEEITFALDESQEMAIKQSIDKRIAIIQGPPGTGKTYIGVKLLQLIASMPTAQEKPILVLTYKNHALDEFLKQIRAVGIKKIARIGGRQQDPLLAEYNLSELKRNFRKSPEVRNQISDISTNMQEVEQNVKGILDELDLQKVLSVRKFVENSTSEQLHSLLTKYNWQAAKLQTILGPDEAYCNYRQKVRRVKRNSANIDSVEIEYILKQTGPIKEYLNSYGGMDAMSRYKHKIFQTLYHTFRAWLPDARTFKEINELLNNASNTAKLYANNGSQENDEGGNEDEVAEETKAEEKARLSAMDMGNKRTLKLEDFTILNTVEFHNLPVIFPIPDDYLTEAYSASLARRENLWEMTPKEKVMFIQNMLHRDYKTLQADIHNELSQYQALHKSKSELEKLHEVHILRDRAVIGMTITGASIHAVLIQQLKPQIIMVEEAAEVMEPQLLSILGPWVKQLFLIGDHKQLRPNVENYELKRHYNLDISMMERLILNGLEFSQLRLQNRMRTEFAELLKDIYPDLKSNLDRVTKNKKLAMLGKSMYFWTHTSPETSPAVKNKSKETPQPVQTLGRSYRNEEEAERCISLALFLIRMGMDPTEITILGAYLGQVRLLREKMRAAVKKHIDLFGLTECDNLPRKPLKLPKVEAEDNTAALRKQVIIQTIDNYQGDENEVIIVSLVRSNNIGKTGFLNTLNRRCVAQSRAKCAMIFIGNYETIMSSRFWQPVLTNMSKQECVGPNLQLVCPLHEDSHKYVTCASDIPIEPFCKKQCWLPMPCGLHSCELKCDPLHQHTRCNKLLPFTYETCGHESERRCFQNVTDMKCMEKIQFNFPCTHIGTRLCYQQESDIRCDRRQQCELDCGHMIEKKCSKSITEIRCKERIPFKAACGHIGNKRCGEDERMIKCLEEVSAKRECGHVFTKKCCEQLNMTLCEEKVPTELDCGHTYQRKCCEEAAYLKCMEQCNRKLEPCGHLCHRKCSQPCDQSKCKMCLKIKRAEEKKQRKEIERLRQESIQQINLEIEMMMYYPGHQIQEIQEIEFSIVSQTFLNTCLKSKWYPSISRITRIHNPRLYQNYLQCRRNMWDPSLTLDMFIYAKQKDVANGGFQGHKSPLRFETDIPAHIRGKGDSCSVVLCEVAVGKSQRVSSIPPKMGVKKLQEAGYDSLFVSGAKLSQSNYFLLYRNSQALPKYVITYKQEDIKIDPLPMSPNGEASNKEYVVHTIKPKREIDLTDALDMHFRIAESQFHRLRERRLVTQLPEIEFIEYHVNKTLISKFEQKETEFKQSSNGEMRRSILAFHGTKPELIASITRNNFDLGKIKRHIHGYGIYFSEFPDISAGYGEGLLLCRVLPGKSFVEKPNKRESKIPDKYHSISVAPDDSGRGKMIVIDNPDQILPCYVIYLKQPKMIPV